MRFERTAADIEVNGFERLAVRGGDFMDIAAGILGKAVADGENFHVNTPFFFRFFSIPPYFYKKCRKL